MALAGDRQSLERPQADRDVPRAQHLADRTRTLRLVVDRRPLLRIRFTYRSIHGSMDDSHVVGREVSKRTVVPSRSWRQ